MTDNPKVDGRNYTADDTRPILTIIGVEGHMSIAKALKKRFDRPIEAMVISGQGKSFADRVDPGVISRIHSLPDFQAGMWSECRAMSDEEVINASREVASRIGLVSVNPHHYFDRNLRRTSDWATAIRRHLVHLRFVEELLVDREYYFIRGENTSHVGNMIQVVAAKLGHRFLRPMTARISGRMEFEGGSPGISLGWHRAYRALTHGGGDIDERTRQEAIDWLEGFVAAPKRPEWANRNTRVRINPTKQLGKYAAIAKGRVVRAFSQDPAMARHDRENRFTGNLGASFFQNFLLSDIRSAIHRRRSLFRQAPDLDGDFIYFPLHFNPEISTLVYGYRHEDQFNLIRAIAAYLPTGYRLLVKEHTSMLGRRPYSFYKQLDSLYNVDFVPPQFSTFDLICNSRAVATITGTAGFEAYALGKPVIACGEVFYRQFPNVLGLEIGPDMGERIQDYLEGYEFDEKAIQNSIIAYFASTFEATSVDIGWTSTREETSRKSENFAAACEWALGVLEADAAEAMSIGTLG